LRLITHQIENSGITTDQRIALAGARKTRRNIKLNRGAIEIKDVEQ